MSFRQKNAVRFPSPPLEDFRCLGSRERNSPKAKARLVPSERARASHWVRVRRPLVSIHNFLFLSGALLFASGPAQSQAQLGPRLQLSAFPPSPFDLPSSAGKAWPKPDNIVQNAERELGLSTGTTNRDELLLAREVEKLRSQFLELEAAANATDPNLRIYGLYIETAHDWVMRNHSAEFGFANNYSRTNPPATQRAFSSVIDLVDMELYRQLSANTNFAPLLKSVFQAMETRTPGKFSTSYARNDRLIGFEPGASPSPKPAASFEAYLAELQQRRELILAKLDNLQREHNIPDQAVLGWMYGDLYRMLDGSAQQYVMLNTPRELDSLRQQLQQKTIQLSRFGHRNATVAEPSRSTNSSQGH